MTPPIPISSQTAPRPPAPSSLELTISAIIALGIVTALFAWLNTSVFLPVTRTVTVTKLDKECRSSWLASSCSYSAFDGSSLYNITREQAIALEPGKKICVTHRALATMQTIALGACPSANSSRDGGAR